MSGQKTIYKCLFLLALFFLCVIFFFLRESNGTDDADNKKAETHTVSPQPDVARAPAPHTEAPAALLQRETVDTDSLALLAVFQAHSPLAAAVIHTEGHGAHRYNVGETLPEGGLLAAIRPTEVIIEDQGRQITLRLALRGGGRAEIADADKDEASAEDDDGPKVPQRVLDFLEKFDLTPVSESSPQGYRVGEDFPESGTQEVGVKPGDTIVTINGYPVGEYHSDYLVWLSFKDTQKASVQVRSEDGKQFSFHYPDDIKGVSGYVPDS
ncbi:hypothetical protein ISO4_03217 [Alcanivorax venustensis ISO4]|uniref:Type II secretion system protein GspC N-terminal domain-containing protein n=1 Tax=Alloalcanivorax venustensis ISO4 TaxID=1177184 RepID=A0ABS0AKP7_9GAMM|nr:type II secretion system protein N [Alloalcanivorax venustensis]MBF5054615.1 hypothetical protein [Alloalcanivorax venustensis ISO4]